MSFHKANKAYDGFFFAKADKAVTLIARVINKVTNASIGSAVIPFAGGNWTKLDFNFTTTGSTACIDGSSDPSVNCGHMGPGAGHVCVSCGAEFQVGLAAPGEVNIDYVYFQPGEWGRVNGLGVLKSGVDNLKAMGITNIRLGGSFTDPEFYFWKRWRGKPWERPVKRRHDVYLPSIFCVCVNVCGCVWVCVVCGCIRRVYASFWYTS